MLKALFGSDTSVRDVGDAEPERLDLPKNEVHGVLGSSTWAAPRLVARSNQANRADQGNNTFAHEFVDDDDVLVAKVKVLADLIRRSKLTVAYTGAGLSKGAGIADYATKAQGTITRTEQLRNPLAALPTKAHHTLVALHRENLLHNWVQQNHDGLPQKAGYPQSEINEIHGAWYDPSNPVVQFSGSLRTDLFNWMLEIEQAAELCLCLGTSLSGMNADRVAETPARKHVKEGKGLGTVIINLQQTRLDKRTSIRIWAPLDTVFTMLADELSIDVDEELAPAPAPSIGEDIFSVPYSSKGKRFKRSSKKMSALDLSVGSFVRITDPNASNYNLVGAVDHKDDEGNYVLCFKPPGKLKRYYTLGRWWVTDALRGVHKQLPVMSVSAETAMPDKVALVQGHRRIQGHLSGNEHEWSLQVSDEHCPAVKSVTYHLHPTFHPPSVTISEAPFRITRTGWGTFAIQADLLLANGTVLNAEHALDFSEERSISSAFN